MSGQRAVINNYKPMNEYVTPLKGVVVFRNSGIIKVLTSRGLKLSVASIIYERFDNEEYQYIISPYWDIIDGLPSNEFPGIPGIKLELRLESYYRVNCEPVFITERTPSSGREDLWELLESVGLDYYDRFEWLLRTDMIAANDNLIVERMRESSERIWYGSRTENMPKVDYILQGTDERGKQFSELLETVQYGDDVYVDELDQISTDVWEFTERLYELLCTGAIIHNRSDGTVYMKSERTALLSILSLQLQKNQKSRRRLQRQGIIRAKQEGKYKGRKKIAVDEVQMQDVYEAIQEKKMSQAEAMKRLNLSSRSTLYRRIKEYEKLLLAQDSVIMNPSDKSKK